MLGGSHVLVEGAYIPEEEFSLFVHQCTPKGLEDCGVRRTVLYPNQRSASESKSQTKASITTLSFPKLRLFFCKHQFKSSSHSWCLCTLPAPSSSLISLRVQTPGCEVPRVPTMNFPSSDAIAPDSREVSQQRRQYLQAATLCLLCSDKI